MHSYKRIIYIGLGMLCSVQSAVHASYANLDSYIFDSDNGIAAKNNDCFTRFRHNVSEIGNLVNENLFEWTYDSEKLFVEHTLEDGGKLYTELMMLDDGIPVVGDLALSCAPQCLDHKAAVARTKKIYQCTKVSVGENRTKYSWIEVGDIRRDSALPDLNSDPNVDPVPVLTDLQGHGYVLFDAVIDPTELVRWTNWCADGYAPLEQYGTTQCVQATLNCNFGDSGPRYRAIGYTMQNGCALAAQYGGLSPIEGWPLVDNAQCVYTCHNTGWTYRLLNSDECAYGYKKQGDLDCVLDHEYTNACVNSGGDGWESVDGINTHLGCKCDKSKHLVRAYNKIECECEDTFEMVRRDDGTFDRCQSTNNTNIKAACIALGNDVAEWSDWNDTCVCKDATKLFRYKRISRAGHCENDDPEYLACTTAEAAASGAQWNMSERLCECGNDTAWNGTECDEVLALEQQLCNASGGEWTTKPNGRQYCNCINSFVDVKKTTHTRFNDKKYTHCKCMPDEEDGEMVYVPSLEKCTPKNEAERRNKTIFDAAEWLSDHSGILTSNATDDANNTETISDLAKTLDAIENAYGLSKWRTVDGKFNYARLASDATAAVVLGTTGALVTSSVVKKKQVEAGFESLECTVGGQHVGDWGDVFRIDGK